MSSSEIGGFVTVVILVVVFALYIRLDWPKNAGYKPNAGNNGQWQSIDGEPRGAAFYTSPSDKDRHEHHHRIGEKRYWIASVALGAVTVTAAIIAAVFAGFAYNAARDQAAAAMEANRPWVKYEDIRLANIAEENAIVSAMVTNTLRNVGHDPALNALSSIKLIDFISEANSEKATCISREVPARAGVTLFPGDHLDNRRFAIGRNRSFFDEIVKRNTKVITDAIKQQKDLSDATKTKMLNNPIQRSNMTSIWLGAAACVVYTDSNKLPHHTFSVAMIGIYDFAANLRMISPSDDVEWVSYAD